ncbi:Copper metallochaperone [Streptomyces venezuelae]|uniref:copper chaperone PCu(A)C n=1 Tax=Streptomyces gardneri TaxID=66892 RepID=UPI0006BD6F0A|nr:copper chaperone PCu(A)C [Streptomyces gardneri]ALO09751.1 Copper metallochaperone [Streptomyces venezuelae]QPK46815.1 copper chaperone PCu(A)C [Streptomyces gardneri]WRK38217.1 copper chaperone PCu(A)C [Streptomyces venezuelae]CUM39816.1 Copper metallochaperone, bacterial analog of Cox17 protein [Streptomyces venezuelae]
MNRRTTALTAAVALAASLALTGCSSDGDKPELKVSGAFMPQPVMDMAGGFLTITNGSGAADKLTSVTSPLSDDITIHESKDQKMRQVTSFDIPANGELKLERGGNHIMFMELKEKPKQGDKVSIELHFEKSDPIKVDVPVEAANHNPQQH